ncbi:MAG: transcriptional regulator [Bradyrhizobium sp.]|uniref:transcriptional regulator n=1 Tax=Bradyrhizobium sp. TaxID=376 RepID=UPI0025C6EC60|nr:transcriptional regulator [Bradyrhizobium sp.]MBI5265551.1 transcriptional regulator [Bradyrhizobium sp.]
MAGKKSAELSPERIARANRQRQASEEGARAMADIEQRAIAVRKNMERLRALRQAKEAEDVKTQAPLPVPTRKKRKRALSG